jgi:hypothetical protein
MTRPGLGVRPLNPGLHQFFLPVVAAGVLDGKTVGNAGLDRSEPEG